MRFEYHHNACRIYDPARFGKTNPEFYPVVEGKPRIPDPKTLGGWQPTFSEPAVVRRAIEYADEVFSKHPEMISISLTVNDGGGYSEIDLRQGKVGANKRISLSNVYGQYVNAVAKGIRKKWPGKFVAFIPYGFMADPPDFPLEDNVLVFPMNEPKAIYVNWQGKAKNFGMYHWLYGAGYIIPNHWPHALQDCLRWGHAHGFRAFKAEAYSVWAQDAPKIWVMANLLWNVDLDVDRLMKDYCEHAYGREAAPAMLRYFARAEKIYERRHTTNAYCFVTSWRPRETQYNDVREDDMKGMADALAKAAGKVKGDDNKKRVDLVTRCFRWSECYWKRVAALRCVRDAKIASGQDVAAVIDAATAFFKLAGESETYYNENIKPFPQLCIYSMDADKVTWVKDARYGDSISTRYEFQWADLESSMIRGFEQVADFKKKTSSPDQLEQFWQGVAARDPRLKAFVDVGRLRLLGPNRPLKNLINNPSFEIPPKPTDPGKGDKDVEVAKDWKIYHNQLASAKVTLDETVAHDGRVSALAQGMSRTSGVRQIIQVPNHKFYRLSFWYKTSKDTEGVVSITRDPYINEKLLEALEWTKFENIFCTAQKHENLFMLIIGVAKGSFESKVWIDDVRLEMLAPEGIAE